MPAFLKGKKRKADKFEDASSEIKTWNCWQCSFQADKAIELCSHLEECSQILFNDPIEGCPFCEISESVDLKTPFMLNVFQEHLQLYHPHVSKLSCPYCQEDHKPPSLLRLTQHILMYHHIYWRPSPYSLAHMRQECLERRITCLGCGFNTKLLIDKDQITPSPSILTHLQICSQNCGNVTTQQCITDLDVREDRTDLITKITRDCENISAHFCHRFPYSRGHVDNEEQRLIPISFMDIREFPMTVDEICDIKYPEEQMLNLKRARITSEEIDTRDSSFNQNYIQTSKLEAPSTLGEKTPVKKPVQVGQSNFFAYSTESGEPIMLPTQKYEEGASAESGQRPCLQPEAVHQTVESCEGKLKRPLKVERAEGKRRESEKKPIKKFDVPFDIPPEPPNASQLRKKKNPDGRVFVCPTCGSSVFTSLRERDEHIEKSHSGELIFPCQLCGMAYPLYIALRRHAALKHSAQFDAVLYGLMPENEPCECPKCRLVAFSDPVVLKMHLAVVHNLDADEKPKKVKKIRTTESEEEYAPTPDEDREETKAPSSSTSSLSRPKVRGRGRGRPPMISSLPTISRVHPRARNEDNDELYSPTKSRPSYRSGRTRKPRGSYRPRGLSKSRVRDPTVVGDNSLANSSQASRQRAMNEEVHNEITELERKLADVSPSEAAALCTICQIHMHNHRELLLHYEIEHNTSTCEKHMGCNVCGRVFFGEHGKLDLIGHLRISHQLQQSESLSEKPAPCSVAQCQGVFTSPRLKSLHPCPIRHLPVHFLKLADSLTNFLDGMPVMERVLATELLADQSGCYILAYGCPDCGYTFTGENATLRYIKHRKEASCRIMMVTQ